MPKRQLKDFAKGLIALETRRRASGVDADAVPE
jgi:hypothetical protein